MSPIPSPESRGDCVRCRHWLLTISARPVPATADSQALQAHLQECASCQRFLDEQRAWRRVGGRLRGELTAPAEIRQRVFRELALARTRWLRDPRDRPRGVRSMVIFTLGLGALIILFGAWWWHSSAALSPPAETARAVIQDYWRDVHRQHIDSTDPAAVQRWLRARLPIVVDVASLPGAELEGARLCWLRDRLGAVLRYRVGEHSLAHYIMPADTRADAVERDRVAIEHEAVPGFTVVMWHEQGMLHALVADLPRARLLQLAAACQAHRRLRVDAPAAADSG